MKQIIELIHKRSSFVLTGHISPDGDAIGSCFGLAFALKKLGKNVTVVLEPYPQKFNVIPGRDFLYTGNVNNLDVDVLIALDCADLTRLGPGQLLFNRAKHTVCIDHHTTNFGFAEFNHIEPETSSTCEIVFRLIEQLTQPDENIASAIYAGIVADTGGFNYSVTAKSTLEIAARLIDIGIPFTTIYNELLNMHSFAAGKALGIVLQNAKQALGGRIIYSHITLAELESVGANSRDVDGFVEYLRNTNGADLAVFVYQSHAPGKVKVSFRSQGPDVGSVAVAMGGGGHRLAAGCTVTATVAEAVEQALNLLVKEIGTHDGRN